MDVSYIEINPVNSYLLVVVIVVIRLIIKLISFTMSKTSNVGEWRVTFQYKKISIGLNIGYIPPSKNVFHNHLWILVLTQHKVQ